MPISLGDIVTLADSILYLKGPIRELFIAAIEATDEVVLEYFYKKNSAKLEDMKSKQSS